MSQISSLVKRVGVLCAVVGCVGDSPVVQPSPDGGGTTDASYSDGGSDATLGVDGADGGDAVAPPTPGTVKLVKSFGGVNQDSVTDVAVDALGAMVLGGIFYSPDVDFGCPQHAKSVQPVTPQADGFVVQLAPDGSCKWVVTLNGTSSDTVNAVGVGADGSVYVAGSTSSANPNLGSSVIAVPGGTSRGFVAKISPQGDVLWTRKFGATGYAAAFDLSVDDSGQQIAIAGTFSKIQGEAIFVPGSSGGLTLGAPDQATSFGFTVVFNPQGDPQWGRTMRTFAGDGDTSGIKVAFDGNGDLLFAGAYSGTGLDVGLYPKAEGPYAVVDPSGGTQTFLSKLSGGSTKGAHLWTKVWGSASDLEPQGLAADANGVVGFTLAPQASIDLGGGLLAFKGGTNDAAYARYQSGGSFAAGRMFGSADTDTASGIALGSAGSFVTGSLAGAVDVGGGVLPHGGDRDMFLAAYAASGAHRWSKSFGGSGFDYGQAVAVTSSTLVLVGGFENNLQVEGQKLTSKGSQDVMLVTFVP